jgi:hypothetical protein
MKPERCMSSGTLSTKAFIVRQTWREGFSQAQPMGTEPTRVIATGWIGRAAKAGPNAERP